MKKLKFWIIGVGVFIFNMGLVNAAPSAVMTVSRSSIENGSSVSATLKVSGVAAWNVKINSSGSTSGCSNSFADVTANGLNTTKSFTVTCKATSVGKITFSYSGDVTASDGSNINISGSKSVNVTAQRVKSSDADLVSLSVEGYELTPSFSKDILEYNLTVDSEVERINIKASKSSTLSTVTNLGMNNVGEGENKIRIIVTAENGGQKTYVINVMVKELNPIIIILDGREYSVVKKLESLEKPSTYEESMTVINEIEVPAFYSEATKFTLVGLKDDEGNVGLYIYNENTTTYLVYEEIEFSKIMFYSIDGSEHRPNGYKECVVSINGVETTGYCKKNIADYVLLYGMNVESGNTGHYVYDKIENTLQRYSEESEDIKADNDNSVEVIVISILALIVGAFVVYCVFRKRKKLSKKK